jgi:LPS export ABC transporter protein LptC
MKRILLRALLIAVILISVPLIFLRTGEGPRLNDVLDVSRLDGKALPELLQRIRDFRRVVTRRGEKLLEVSAAEASYFRDDKTVQILAPSLTFFSEGEKVGAISGQRGRLKMDGNDVDSVEMTGNVELSLVQFEIHADSLTYERRRDSIVAAGPAVVRSPELELHGSGMMFDLNARTLRIDSGVDMTLRKIIAPSDERRILPTEPAS